MYSPRKVKSFYLHILNLITELIGVNMVLIQTEYPISDTINKKVSNKLEKDFGSKLVIKNLLKKPERKPAKRRVK